MTIAPRRRRLLVIFNPIAGRRARQRLDAALAALERLGVAIEVRETQAPGDAEAFARGARASDFDAIAVAGGDGTMNEVVNGLADPDLPVAILSLGTANVLAHEIGLPRDPCRLAEIVATGPARRVALGEALFENGSPARRFVLMTGIGFDVSTSGGSSLGKKVSLKFPTRDCHNDCSSSLGSSKCSSGSGAEVGGVLKSNVAICYPSPWF